jgi:hypothetical protein
MERPTGLKRVTAQIGLALAWLFAAAVVVQIFLAGLALFDNASRWANHKSFGMMIGPLVLLLVVTVLIGRLPRRIVGMSLVLLVLYLIQISLPSVGGYTAALHPLVAFAVLGLPVQIGFRLLGYLRQSTRATARGHIATERSSSSWTSS